LLLVNQTQRTDISKMPEQNKMTRNDLEARLVAHAWQDDEFKQELLSNPRAAFKREFGDVISLSEDLNIHVIEEKDKTFCLVIPKKPNMNTEELSEEQLEEVAGGIGILGAVAIGVGVTFVAGAVDGYLENT
jgi:hypothetical protein